MYAGTDRRQKHSSNQIATTALGGCGQHKAADTLPPAKIWYSLYRRLGGPQGQCGEVQKISFPLGFNPQTIQPVASRSTDYAMPAAQSSRS